MKRTYYLFLLFALILTGCEKSGEQEIPSEDEPVNILDSMTDAWFRDYCLSYYDADHNGEVSPEEVAGVTSLDFSRRSCTSLSGIEYFTGLTMLDVRWSDLEDIDLSANTAITDFKARSCQSLVSADLSGTAITHLSRDVLASCRALDGQRVRKWAPAREFCRTMQQNSPSYIIRTMPLCWSVPGKSCWPLPGMQWLYRPTATGRRSSTNHWYGLPRYVTCRHTTILSAP